MAEHKYISLKICGNPESNGGFMPLIIFNNPSFDVLDQVYSGFDSNSYFYTILIEKDKVVYTLVKNNVRSFEAFRPGSLKIAFSIPKGYKLDGSISPDEVLTKILDKFLSLCMTCKDSVKGTYEFKKGIVDPHILDDIAKEFTISTCGGPFHPMTQGGPIGYVVADDIKISQLLNDVQYSEFSKYSLIIAAEDGGSNNYTNLQNLEIPRQPEYSILVDGQQMDLLKDIHKTLVFNGNQNPAYFENYHLEFTIEQLLNNDRIENVVFDRENDVVEISMAGLSKPRVQTIELKFSSKEILQYFCINKQYVKLTYGPAEVQLSNNLDFTLEGAELRLLENPKQFKFECLRTDKYIIGETRYIGNYLEVDVSEVPKQSGEIASAVGICGTKPDNTIGFNLFIDKNLSKNYRAISIIAGEDSSLAPMIRTNKSICYDKKNRGYINISVPKEWTRYTSFSVYLYTDHLYYSRNIISLKDVSLSKENMEKHKIKNNSKFKSLALSLIFIFVSLLFGGLIGFFIRDRYVDINNGGGSLTDSIAEIKKDTIAELDDRQINEILKKSDNKLFEKELSFLDVEKMYSQICKSPYSEKFKQVEDGKVYDRVNDYHEVVTAIQSADLERVKTLIDRFGSDSNPLHIWDFHNNDVRLLCYENVNGKNIEISDSKRENIRSLLRNRKNKLNCFKDIKELISKEYGNSNQKEKSKKNNSSNPGNNEESDDER